MPYPNEHSCRIAEPSLFIKDSFRRFKRTVDGKTVYLIGAKLKKTKQFKVQSIRFPVSEWTEAEARKLCKGKFEPAG